MIKNLRFHNITTEDIKNGDGLRTVLWIAGCEHRCPECQNPVTWDFTGGVPFDDKAMDELLESLKPEYISGITFSGGDPLALRNRPGILKIISKIKDKDSGLSDKTIWIYTGYTWECLLSHIETKLSLIGILKYTDVLVDGRYDKDLRDVTLKWRGSSNQRVIIVQKSLKTGNVVLHCD